MQGNQKRNRLRLGAVPTIDVPVFVEPCFKLLYDTERKRSAARAKMANIMGVSNRPDAQQTGCKRAHEDDGGADGEDGSAKIVSPVIKERAERKNQRKCPKLDQQECFLMAVGLIPVDSVW